MANRIVAPPKGWNTHAAFTNALTAVECAAESLSRAVIELQALAPTLEEWAVLEEGIEAPDSLFNAECPEHGWQRVGPKYLCPMCGKRSYTAAELKGGMGGSR